MRVRMIGFLSVILIVFSVRFSQAQDAATWFWAVNEEKGQLLAYTADGQVNTLIDGGVKQNADQDILEITRFGEDSALGVIRVGGKKGVYHLTSVAARPIQLPSLTVPSARAVEDAMRLVAVHGVYGLLIPSTTDPFPGLLVNMDTDQVEVLSGAIERPVGFSNDGVYLRYASRDQAQPDVVNLWERKLDSGTEWMIAAIPGQPSPTVITSDGSSEHWLYSEKTADGGITYSLVDVSGETTVVAAEKQAGRIWRIVGDYLFAMARGCLTGKVCTITRQSLSDGSKIDFTLPFGGVVFPASWSGDKGQVFIQSDSKQTVLWLVGSDGTAEKLGGWATNLAYAPTSPDRRWLLLKEDARNAGQYRVWDSVTQTFVVERDFGADTQFVAAFFGSHGLVLTQNNQHFWLYRYDDGMLLDLPSDPISYFDVPTDDSLLAEQREAASGRGKGIYRYDLATKTFTLLAADAAPVELWQVDRS